MASKGFLVICVQILLVKAVFTQTCGCALSNAGLSNNLVSNIGLSNIGSSYSYNAQPVVSLASLLSSTSPQLLDNLSYGGSLTVSSGSSVAPNGITVFSENSIDGKVSVSGNLPLLGSVTVGGSVPTAGQAAVVYNTRPGVGLSSGGCGAGLPGVSIPGLSAGVGCSGANTGLVLANGCTSSGYKL